jgi:pimeloyl-ACP methyl ester carboxylesterase
MIGPSNIRRFSVEVDGGRVSGLRWGEGEPELVFLHGGGQNAHAWDRLLSMQTWSAVALDLPGHGQSSWFTRPRYLPIPLAERVAHASSALGLMPAAVVGMSLGGLAALELARIEGFSMTSLVVVDASPGNTPARSGSYLNLMGRDRFESLEDMAGYVAEALDVPETESLRDGLRRNARTTSDGTWTWLADTRELTGRSSRSDDLFAAMPDVWNAVEAVRCPALIVKASRSSVVSVDDLDRYGRNPAFSAHVLDCGHRIQAECPRELAALIQRTLAR